MKTPQSPAEQAAPAPESLTTSAAELSALRSDLAAALNLPPGADAAAILGEAQRLGAAARQAANERDEAAIVRQVIRESCGGLTETTAREVIARHGGFKAYQSKNPAAS
jgi:hypothetical protein